MHRRDVFRTGTAVWGGTLAVIGGCAARSDGPAFRAGFEDGPGDWTADAAIGPEVDVREFEWAVDVSSEQASAGDRSLRVFNEGDYDDGTTWVTHPVDVGATESFTARVTAQFWSESESFNTLRDAVMRLGPEPPTAEADFPHPGVNTSALGETPYGGLREPLWLADGWRAYAFEWTASGVSTETCYLSLGTSVIWEGDATHYLDEVAVAFDPSTTA